MMASSSWRTVVDGYCKGKYCFICSQVYDSGSKKPVYKCTLCQTAYHHSCHEAAFGKDAHSRCCSPAADCKVTLGCRFCLKKTGLLLEKSNSDPYHLECLFNDRFIVNRRIGPHSGTRACDACGSSKGVVFECADINQHSCKQAFHFVCHQKLLLSLPLSLERILNGDRIELVCAAHQQERHQHQIKFYIAHRWRLSQQVQDEEKPIFRVEEQTISRIEEDPVNEMDLSLQILLDELHVKNELIRPESNRKQASTSIMPVEMGRVDNTEPSKAVSQEQLISTKNMLGLTGSNQSSKSRWEVGDTVEAEPQSNKGLPDWWTKFLKQPIGLVALSQEGVERCGCEGDSSEQLRYTKPEQGARRTEQGGSQEDEELRTREVLAVLNTLVFTPKVALAE